MMRILGCLMVMTLFLAAPAQAVPTITLLPPTGSLEAAPGETVGWGYEIVNDDPDLWLVVLGLTPSGFQSGTGSDLIFDYPIVAPDSTLTRTYIPGTQGLYEFTFDPNTPAGFVTSGVFQISVGLWAGDPFAGADFVGMLDDFLLPYSVSTPAPPPTNVPEPGTLLLLSSGIGIVGLSRQRRTARRR